MKKLVLIAIYVVASVLSTSAQQIKVSMPSSKEASVKNLKPAKNLVVSFLKPNPELRKSVTDDFELQLLEGNFAENFYLRQDTVCPDKSKFLQAKQSLSGMTLLLAQQLKGEEGNLLTNGKFNVFPTVATNSAILYIALQWDGCSSLWKHVEITEFALIPSGAKFFYLSTIEGNTPTAKEVVTSLKKSAIGKIFFGKK